MDFFFLAVIFFVASAATGRFSPIYIVVGSLSLFVSGQEDLFFFLFQLAACVVFGCCVLGVVLFSQFRSAYLVLAYSFFALILTLFSVGCVSMHFGYFCRVSRFLFSPYYICRMDHFGKTVTVQTPPEFRRFTQATVLPGILVDIGKDAIHSVQFLPGGSFRALFSSPESHECVVQATGPPQVDVYVHYYPFEAPDADIFSVLSKFGQIKGLRYQSFPGYSNVKTGSRIVRMVVEREIPSQQSIRGYPCRVWYKGQPIRCNICREVGHLAASCPNKGLCRRCKEPGHTAGHCTRASSTAQVSVPAVAGPSSSGVSPAAPAPRPQLGAVCERAPPASVPDPFEETEILLAEAMDTASVASDVDYTDSEVDEVDEAVSDGSNGISDYDTSEEDHLLEEVDLSLEKTRSASKRAKRESGVQSRNAPAPAVSSSAAAAPAVLVAPAAPAVPAAPAAPASSAVQSSTPQCASGAPKENACDISSVSKSTEPKTRNSEITSVNNSVEGNVGTVRGSEDFYKEK